MNGEIHKSRGRSGGEVEEVGKGGYRGGEGS